MTREEERILGRDLAGWRPCGLQPVLDAISAGAPPIIFADGLWPGARRTARYEPGDPDGAP